MALSLVLNQREPVPDFPGEIGTRDPQLAQPETLKKGRAADVSTESLRVLKEEAETGADIARRRQAAGTSVAAPAPGRSPAR